MLWHEKEKLEQFAAAKPSEGGDRMLPFLLLWSQGIGATSAPHTLCWKGDGRTPVAIFRTAWQDDATYVA